MYCVEESRFAWTQCCEGFVNMAPDWALVSCGDFSQNLQIHIKSSSLERDGWPTGSFWMMAWASTSWDAILWMPRWFGHPDEHGWCGHPGREHGWCAWSVEVAINLEYDSYIRCTWTVTHERNISDFWIKNLFIYNKSTAWSTWLLNQK
jgi:hypothetical protein